MPMVCPTCGRWIANYNSCSNCGYDARFDKHETKDATGDYPSRVKAHIDYMEKGRKKRSEKEACHHCENYETCKKNMVAQGGKISDLSLCNWYKDKEKK